MASSPFPPKVVRQVVEVWQPEPIGAAIANSIQAQYGAAMASTSGQWVGWGLQGSQETTSQAIIAPVQQFVGGPILPPVIPTPGELPGLPGTVVPPALGPFGLGT